MKKLFFVLSFLWTLAAPAAIPVSCEKISLIVAKVPVGGLGNPVPRTPVEIPTVGMDGRTLYFEADHPTFTLVLLDEDGEVAYTVVIPTAVEEITLPSDLIGNYELQLYDGSNFYFYCDIVL